MIENIVRFFEPVAIQRWAAATDAWGGTIKNWQAHLTIEGRVRPLAGEERFTGDKKTLFATHRLYCFPADITEKDRVVYGGKNYDIKFVADVMNFDRLMQIDLELVE